MITFLQLGNYGRLGNQLFQYAALKAAALKHNYVCKIPQLIDKHCHGQACLLSNFNIQSEYINDNELSSITHTISDNFLLPGAYSPILEHIPDNINLNGFFQNTKYFNSFEKLIIEELTPKKEIIEKQLLEMSKIKKRDENLVSLHIRTGDLIDGTNPIYNKYYGKGPFDRNTVVGRYIIKSLDMIATDIKTKILISVGGSRSGNDTNDIKWAKNYFSDKKFIVNDSNDPITDFTKISLCDHNIISFSSSFSWWAAYINKNPNKKVFCPIDYHFDQQHSLREGFYPSDWIQV